METTTSKSTTLRVVMFALVAGALVRNVSAAKGDGGSKCPDASCTPAPPGAQCEPKYGEQSECCPVWHCTNGQTAYGMTRSSSNGFSSFSSSSSSTGNNGAFQLPSMNPFGGSNNPFAGLFGSHGGFFGGFGRR